MTATDKAIFEVIEASEYPLTITDLAMYAAQATGTASDKRVARIYYRIHALIEAGRLDYDGDVKVAR